MSDRFLNELIEGADTTASGKSFQELLTRCENQYAAIISLVLGFSIGPLCLLSCRDLVRSKREDICDISNHLLVRNQSVSNRIEQCDSASQAVICTANPGVLELHR